MKMNEHESLWPQTASKLGVERLDLSNLRKTTPNPFVMVKALKKSFIA